MKQNRNFFRVKCNKIGTFNDSCNKSGTFIPFYQVDKNIYNNECSSFVAKIWVNI